MTMPAQNCCFLAVASTSYLRTKSSLPSPPMRNTDRPAAERADGVPSRTGIGQTDARDQNPPARIDPEGAQVIRVPVDVLDQCRLAGRLVDGEDRDRFSPPANTFLPSKSVSRVGAVGEIDEAPVGMHMDRARGLPQSSMRDRRACP